MKFPHVWKNTGLNDRSNMSKYRKRPVIIEAFLWTGGRDQTEDPEWIVALIESGDVFFREGENPKMFIRTLGGTMQADSGDWVIKGVSGEVYTCNPDLFKATYEPVEEVEA